MSAITGTTHKLAETISVNLKTPSSQENIAGKIASHLSKVEEELMKLYSEPGKDGKYDEKAIEEKRMNYQRTMRVYEGFQQLMRNAHEMILRGIQNLRVS